MPNTVAELIAKEKEKYEGKWFCGVPDEWVDDGRWWCAEGHRSKHIVVRINGTWVLEHKPRLHHKGLCTTCREPVMLGPKDLPVLEP